MGLPKLFTLLCCTAAVCLASHDNHHYTHVIPVEGYDTELQDLGEHVEYPEPPVKVVKITKTVAVKVPVPYPVKLVEKVPYPVHINKPYPVPVPQIIKVPVAQHPHGHEALDVGHGNSQNGGYGNFQGGGQSNFHGDGQGSFQGDGHGDFQQAGHDHFEDRQHNGNPYQVQEHPNDSQEESLGTQSYDEGNHGNSYSGSNDGGYSAAGSSGYQSQQPQDFYGSTGDLDGHNSFESQSYDLAIQNYLNNQKQKHQAGQGVY